MTADPIQAQPRPDAPALPELPNAGPPEGGTPNGPAAPALPEFPNWLCLSVLAALTLAIFSGVLLARPGEVLSDPRMDLSLFLCPLALFWIP